MSQPSRGHIFDPFFTTNRPGIGVIESARTVLARLDAGRTSFVRVHIGGTMKIEVYEWKEGDVRPGSDHVHRNVCLEVLDLPSDVTAPARGDILRLRLPNVDEPTSDNAWSTTPFVVLEREAVCSVREKAENSHVPLKVMAMWLFVRSINDYSKLVALPES